MTGSFEHRCGEQGRLRQLRVVGTSARPGPVLDPAPSREGIDEWIDVLLEELAPVLASIALHPTT